MKRCFLPPSAGFGLVMVLLSPVFAPVAGCVSSAPPAPGGVVANVADRRLTVVWNAVSGATDYRIAVRPKNEPAPLTWREYTVTSSPWTMDAWAMGGLRYEVRAAARNADGQSAWSSTATTTAPVLRAAPADAIDTGRVPPPYGVGYTAQVALTDRPFENRSAWRWFLCDADGSGCDLQPTARPTWAYRLGSETRGKRVRVQVDYDKDGVSYTAQAVLGVVDAAEGEGFTEDKVLTTHLYALQSRWVGLGGLGWDGRTGGAVDSLHDDLLVAAPWGDFALVRRHGTVSYLDGNVPMSEAGRLEGDPAFEHVRPDRFRVADVLLKPRSAERWELFVTHHYFTGECIRFRLSSTTILRVGGRVTISPSWRTIFDADPCLPTRHQGGHQAGGKILADGRDHLLVVVGDHAMERTPQAGDSHLGKLVRVEIATGDTEVLAFGLRNPQGLARDRNGDLWETEHGPSGGDELNLLEPGGNYGWPAVTYGVGYDGRVNVRRAAETGRHDGFVRPVFSWVPSIGVSAVVVNDDSAFPLWRDDLLVASLLGPLYRVRRHRRIAQYVEQIRFSHGIRDLAQMPDGRIAVLSNHGRVYFLSRSDAYCDGRSRELRLVWSVGCGSVDGTADP